VHDGDGIHPKETPMTTTTNPACAVCGNGMHTLPWGAEVPAADHAVIELDGVRYPVHRGCIRSFVASPDEDAEAWEGQRRSVEPVDRRHADIDLAHRLWGAGRSLYEISVETGRSKEWLRTYAGLR
jgi:hypothetical protein